ncbi:MAG: RNA-directed DNA polymerase, partial [bacterium]|nr:RNA-directed DNA polymerase [bacterium]
GLAPRIERALVNDCFACRKGKGSLAAAKRSQAMLSRFPWYVQVDVRSYFASIDHGILLEHLARLFRCPRLLALLARMLEAYSHQAGKGLPIGALTSQWFANLYLAPFDRYLQGQEHTLGMVRYMDDVVWWVRGDRRTSLVEARTWIHDRLGLELHRERIQRSRSGLTLVGYRVFADHLGLTSRRKRRYRMARRRWEQAFEAGWIDSAQLQARGDAALAICAHTRSRSFRRADLLRRPAVDA